MFAHETERMGRSRGEVKRRRGIEGKREEQREREAVDRRSMFKVPKTPYHE